MPNFDPNTPEGANNGRKAANGGIDPDYPSRRPEIAPNPIHTVKSRFDRVLGNIFGAIVLLIIVFAVLVAAWQDPSGQGKFCLGLIGLVIAGYVILRRRRIDSSKPDSRTSF